VTADELLNLLFNGGVAVSIGATVASLGMTYTVGELTVPLRRVGLVASALALNAVALPAQPGASARRFHSARRSYPA
jgi:hypothetical protein